MAGLYKMFSVEIYSVLWLKCVGICESKVCKLKDSCLQLQEVRPSARLGWYLYEV